ncbi:MULTISPECIES: hypothetical protein [unclassified Streptomyces]|uniref:hypothetical protein n=1 Tax=unclassified Streptomyces TaxID=2593676 RepID=UPI002E2CACFC|nr:hypothetical protein [Streptomyces sp. NBC_01439]
MLWEGQLEAESVEQTVTVFDFSRGGGLANLVKTGCAPRLGGDRNRTLSGPVIQCLLLRLT